MELSLLFYLFKKKKSKSLKYTDSMNVKIREKKNK
jgi:hypothetical protein